MCVFMIAVLAFVCTPAFSEVPTFQYACERAGDSQDDSTLYADSATLPAVKFIGYEISPSRKEIAVSRTLQIAKADNSVSREASPSDDWGAALA